MLWKNLSQDKEIAIYWPSENGSGMIVQLATFFQYAESLNTRGMQINVVKLKTVQQFSFT